MAIWDIKERYKKARANEFRGQRALWGGGQTPSLTTDVQYLTMNTLGDAIDFGDLSVARGNLGAHGNTTRAVFMGGAEPGYSNVIDILGFAAIGSNAADFGNLTAPKSGGGVAGNKIRALHHSGYTTGDNLSDIIDYITIATTGNATDFGNSSQERYTNGGCSSPTRALFGAGDSPALRDTIDYVTIASTGNATDFGDLTDAKNNTAATSSTTRGIFAGGGDPAVSNIIEYVTIASTGNATDFGDLLAAASVYESGVSNNTKGIFAGGYTGSPSALQNVIQYVTIASTGDAADWGDLTTAKGAFGGASDGGGGLQ